MCLADLSRIEVRDLITHYSDRWTEVGCVVFEGDPSCREAVIVFAGNAERFYMLAACRDLRCRVIFVQDPTSGWYQGSSLLPPLQDLCRSLLKEVGPRRVMLFGQSSGAYAALVASTFFMGSTVLACAPQTFDDGVVKSRIHFAGIRALSTPPDIVDVRRHLAAHQDGSSCRAVVISASEMGNPASAHYWMDYLHALRLAELDTVSLSVVSGDTHVPIHGRVDQFATLLAALAKQLSEPPEQRIRTVREFLDRSFGAPRP